MPPLDPCVFEAKVGRDTRIQPKNCASVGRFSAKWVLSDKLLGKGKPERQLQPPLLTTHRRTEPLAVWPSFFVHRARYGQTAGRDTCADLEGPINR